MPNKETKHYSHKLDEKVALLIGEAVVRPLAAKMAQVQQQADRIAQRDPADPYLPVLTRKLEVDNELFERLEELMRGLAADQVRLVAEGALVHEVAERLALSERTFAKRTGDRDASKEAYIGTAQHLLADVKSKGVIL